MWDKVFIIKKLLSLKIKKSQNKYFFSKGKNLGWPSDSYRAQTVAPHVCSGSLTRNRVEFQTRTSENKHDPAK